MEEIHPLLKGLGGGKRFFLPTVRRTVLQLQPEAYQ